MTYLAESIYLSLFCTLQWYHNVSEALYVGIFSSSLLPLIFEKVPPHQRPMPWPVRSERSSEKYLFTKTIGVFSFWKGCNFSQFPKVPYTQDYRLAGIQFQFSTSQTHFLENLKNYSLFKLENIVKLLLAIWE